MRHSAFRTRLLLWALLCMPLSAQTLLMDDRMISAARTGTANGAAQVDMDHRGNVAVCWRQTAPADNYYVRLIDSSGIFLGEPTPVGTIGRPAVSAFCFDMSDSGTFAVAWTDNKSIYLRRYNPGGSAFDAFPLEITLPGTDSIRINSLSMALRSTGEILLCWRPFQLEIRTIEGMILGAGQVPSQERFTLAPSGATSLSDPVIAASDRSFFAIAYRYIQSTVRENRIAVYRSSPSITLDSTIVVGDSTEDRIEGLAMTRAGMFVAAWYEALQSGSHLVHRRYGVKGRPIGNVTMIQTSPNPFYKIRVKTGANGDYIVSWLVRWTVGGQLRYTPFCRMYDMDGTPISGHLLPADDSRDNNLAAVDATIDGTNKAAMVFDNSDNAPAVQFFWKNGTMVRSNTPFCHPPVSSTNPAAALGRIRRGVNCAFAWEDATNRQVNVLDFTILSGVLGAKNGYAFVNDSSSEAARPAISCDSATAFMAWEDQRQGAAAPACYGQLLGLPSAADLSISNQGVTASYPACAIGRSTVLAIWQDVRAANGTTTQIYAQRLNRAGSPQGENFKVNGTLANAGSPAVAVDGAGTFFVVWNTTGGALPNLTSNVYLQRVSSAGALLGTPQTVNSTANRAGTPVVAADSAGNVAVAWLDQRDAIFVNHVYCRRFDASGNPLGAEFRCDTSAAGKSYPGVGIGTSGVIVVSWQSGTGAAQTVMSRQFSASQTALTGEVKHNNDVIRSAAAAPSLAVADSFMMLSWLNSSHTIVANRDVWAEVRTITHSGTGVAGPGPGLGASGTRVSFCQSGNRLVFDRRAAAADLYSLDGRLIRRVCWAGSIDLPKGRGLFVLNIDGQSSRVFSTVR